MFTIIGAGFGLYGYMPALLNRFDDKVLLPEPYRIRFESRPELQYCAPRIQWCTEEEALRRANGVVIAVPPAAQLALMDEIVSAHGASNLIIEKPMAPTPLDAEHLLAKLVASAKRFRVGYTFLYTNWFRDLFGRIDQSSGKFRIDWNFCAHHLQNNLQTWKRFHSMGGGVLRFYGVHLLAVLAALGYDEVIRSMLVWRDENQPVQWTAQFSGRNRPNCDVSVQIDSALTEFQVNVEGNDSYNFFRFTGQSPFSLRNNDDQGDERIHALESLISSFNEDDVRYVRLYAATNNLWKKAELMSNSLTS